ncbi:ABC transporter permease [Pontibacillus salicampi]|uniref:ABC transporter permease n=1 Tax=Pontibacillus salicampi TaxID=1449801 RepID=A0ABV6LRQ3_9BACI
MRALLWARWKGFRKHKWLFVIMLILPIAFTFFFSLSGTGSPSTLPVVVEEKSAATERFLTLLEQPDWFEVEEVSAPELEEGLISGAYGAGIELNAGALEQVENGQAVSFTIYRLTDSQEVQLVEQSVQDAARKLHLEAAMTTDIVQALPEDLGMNESVIRSNVETTLAQQTPVYVNKAAFGQEEAVIYDATFQALVGFTLFFTMYTIIFTLGEMIEDEQKKILNRLVISPVSTWKIYSANIVYSFLIGYSQLLVLVLVGKYVFQIEWGERLGAVAIMLALYVLATMAVGMVLLCLSRNMQQLSAITPIVAVSFAMLGGAYWPIEIVQNELLVSMANIVPIFHAMNGLKTVVLYDQGLGAASDSLLWLIGMIIVWFSVGVKLFGKRITM